MGRARHRSTGGRRVGTITASRPPGFSTRAISDSAAAGSRDQLQHRDRDRGVDGRITQRKSLRVRPQEPDLRTRGRAHRAHQHRFGDVDAQGKAVDSGGVSQRCGDGTGTRANVQCDAALRDVQPFDGQLPRGDEPAGQGLGVVVEERPDRRGPHRLDSAVVLGHLVVPVDRGAEQVQIAVTDIRLAGRVNQQIQCPTQGGRQRRTHICHVRSFDEISSFTGVYELTTKIRRARSSVRSLRLGRRRFHPPR